MSAEKQKTPRSELLIFCVAIAAYVCLHTLLLGVIPQMSAAYGANPGQVGLILLVYAGFGILTEISVGRLTGRWGVRAVVLLGCACYLADAVLLLVAGSIATLIPASLVMALGSSFLAGPVTGGMASAAAIWGMRGQGLNVVMQRLGALGAAFLFGMVYLTLGTASGAIWWSHSAA